MLEVASIHLATKDVPNTPEHTINRGPGKTSFQVWRQYSVNRVLGIDSAEAPVFSTRSCE